MNINIEKSNDLVSSLSGSNDLKEFNKTFSEFCSEIKYYDDKDNMPSPDLLENENFNLLKNYAQDATFVIAFANYDVDEFIENITETETDLLTYLENFVYDDTEHETVKDYIANEFETTDKFALHLLKNYFCHNFKEYLNLLS